MSHKTNVATAWAAALAFAATSALAGCGSGDTQTAEKMTSYKAKEAPDEAARLFTIPQEQMSHIQVVPVKSSKLARVLRLTGTVAYNAFVTTPVITQVGGPVSRIAVMPGQVVQKGQAMLYVSSPDFAVSRSSYLKARNVSRVADKEYARAQDLYSHHAIAERDLLVAESARTQAQADLQSSEQALRILGVANPESLAGDAVAPEIPVLAPIAGEVVERLVSPGQVVQAGGTQCFTISDVSSVWVLANIYQNDLASVHVGEDVSIQTDAYPATFHGKISYIAPALDPNTRTLQARIVTSNPGGKLKKDMYVMVLVRAGTIEKALTVPDSAVLRDSENIPFVYVTAGNNQFGRRRVTIGETGDGKTQILSGLAAGERVVADGSLFVQFANSLQH
jgi:cobalt-zinc-cadmium efflux system membrane fusion protein